MLGDPAGWRAVPAGLAGAAQGEVDGVVAEEPVAAGEVAAGVLGAGPGDFGGRVTIFAVVTHGASPSCVGRRHGSPKEFFAVADPEQEDEPVQVGAERAGAVGGVAGMGLEAAGEGLFLAARARCPRSHVLSAD